MCREHRERVIIAVPRSLAHKNVVGLFMHFILDIRKKIIPNNNHNRFDEWYNITFFFTPIHIICLLWSLPQWSYCYVIVGQANFVWKINRISRIYFPILKYIRFCSAREAVWSLVCENDIEKRIILNSWCKFENMLYLVVINNCCDMEHWTMQI